MVTESLSDENVSGPEGAGALIASAPRRARQNATTSARPPWMEKPSPPAVVSKGVLLSAIAVIMIFPFIYVIAVSFSSYQDVVRGGVILWPQHPTLEAYRAILSGGIVVNALKVSILLTLGGTAFNLFMTTTLAYGLSRKGVPGSRFVLGLVLFTLLFSPGLIPNYLLVKQLGLINSYGSLVLPVAINAFNLVILRQAFMERSAHLSGHHHPPLAAGARGGRPLLWRRALEQLLLRHALPERREQVADPARAAAIRAARQCARQRSEY